MRPSQRPPILLTHEDFSRLRAVVDRYLEGAQRHAAEMLDFELARAQLYHQHELPKDVVTMRSRVVFEMVDSSEQREVTLVYPQEADVSQSKISVLAPVGMALLGATKGQVIEWPVPGDRMRTIRVLSVVYQPEAAGDLHL